MTSFPAKEIKTVSATKMETMLYPAGSKNFYECANPFITRGITTQPTTYQDCLNNSLFGSKISAIVNQISGFSPTWFGPQSLIEVPSSIDSGLIGSASPECDQIESSLGANWKGCFWSAPDSILSCECPEVGANYLNYLKLRLNVATFWNTAAKTPIQRKRFLDSISYGPKITISVAPDLKLRPGVVIDVYADTISGYSTAWGTSSINGKYYVLSVKSTLTNSGSGETAVTAVKLLY
jgi:hypothetical protein